VGKEIDLLANYPKAKRNVESRGQEKTDEDRKIAREFGEEFFDGDLLPKAYFWIKHQYTIDIKQQHPISPMSYCNR